MVWAIEYAESAKKQLRKLDKPMARRIVDFMDERVAISDDPRRVGKVRERDLWAISGVIAWAITGFFAIFRTGY